MRGALIHGILLAVMLVYGYRTWTRDKTVQPNVGNVVLWNKSEADIVSIQLTSPKKIVKLERNPGGYWWGSETSIETKMKPAAPKPADAGSAAGSADAGSAAGSAAAGSAAGSGAGSGSAAKEPEVVTIEEEEIDRKTKEFPVGDAAEKLIKQYASARALRDLGKPSDAAKKDYKLGQKPALSVTMKDGKTVSTSIITVTFKDGSKSFLLGGSVYGGSDKYVMEEQSGKAYVFSKDLLSGLEIGQSSLQLLDPRGFDASTIGSVTIEANGKTKTFARITTTGADNTKQLKTWGDPATKKADQTAANFIDNANNLRPTEYASSLKVDQLTPVMKLAYKDEHGGALGTLSLYKREKPGQLAEGQELDPANPPKGETEYYIMTEKTRVPALVRKDTAQRSEQDIETVFSGKQPEPKSAVEPHGNPFGANAPAPDTHGGSAAPVNPHGAPAPGAPDPHAGMPTPAGSAAAQPPATPAAAGSAAPKPAAPAEKKAAGSAAPAPAP